MLISHDKIYVHADGGRYRVLNLGIKMKCPVTGEWLKAVLYEHEHEDYGTGIEYVRTQKDFCARFTPMPKKTS